MSGIKFTNNAVLTSPLTIFSGDHEILVDKTEAARFPRIDIFPESEPAYFYATIYDNQGNVEIIKVVGINAYPPADPNQELWSIERGQEGTAIPDWWPEGTKIELRLTSQGIMDIQEQTKEKAVEEISNATPRVTLSNDVTAGPVEYNPLEGFSLPVSVNRAPQLTNARTFQTNLASTAAASFNGTANVTPGVTGILSTANGGTGNTSGLAASATKLAATRTLLVNLASTTSANFDGSSNVTIGISGILPIANGGTGNSTGTVNNATKLATSRTIQTNLASTSSASFDGTANVTPGVTGTLPVTNGGTGATTPTAALTNLGITYGTADLTAGTSALTTGAIYLVYE